MSLTTPERSYTVVANVAVGAGSTLASNRALFRSFVSRLLAAGAVVNHSCDSVTAGTPGDGINYLASDGDVVFDDAGSPHSWIVLTLPSGFASMGLLIEAVQNGAVDGNLKAYLVVGGWSGGTVTDIPTPSTVGDNIAELSFGSATLLPTSNYSAKVHLIYASDHTSIRIAVVDDISNSVISFLLLEKHYGGPVAYTVPYGGTWATTDYLANMFWVGFLEDRTAPANGTLASLGTSTGLLTIGIVQTYDPDGKLGLQPVGVAFGTPTTQWLGYIPDLFSVYNDGATYGLSIPSGSSRVWMCLGNLVVPWAGAAALGGSSDAKIFVLNAAPSIVGVGQLNTIRFDALAGFGSNASGGGGGDGLGPVISLVTPPAGELDEDRVTAIHTPISFRLTDADGIKDVVITVLFAGANEPVVAFDDEGWRGRFLGNSTNSATPGAGGPTTIDFVVFPAGGWRANITALKINGLDVFGSKEGVDV